MEFTKTKTTQSESNAFDFANIDGSDQSVQERLDNLSSLNKSYEEQEAIFISDIEKSEADSMKNPYSLKKAFSIFGLLLGTLPPAAILAKIISESNGSIFDEPLIFSLIIIANLVSATVGYLTGGLIGKLTFELEKHPWHLMLLALPFLGLLWGVIAGGAGGLFIFVFGTVFGAMIGGLVGSIALPVFTIFHRILKKGDKIEQSQFLPIAFGIALIISAFILGI